MCMCVLRAAALVGVLRASGTPTAAYATMAAVEALAAVVCLPGAGSTDPILRHALLSEAGALGHPLFALFSHPARMHTLLSRTSILYLCLRRLSRN